MLRHLLSAKYFEEMYKQNIVILTSLIENLAKIVMDSVKNYVRQYTNHVRVDIKNICRFSRIGLSYQVVEHNNIEQQLNGSISVPATSIFQYS